MAEQQIVGISVDEFQQMSSRFEILHGEVIADTRASDVSFIRHENLPTDFDWSKPIPGKPDLAVEVVSSNERADILQAKISDYASVGTTQVWVIYPQQKIIYVHNFAAQLASTPTFSPVWAIRCGFITK